MSKIKLEVEMDNRWVPTFLSFLRTMEFNGNIGHSETLAIYSDGDGDFRPKFHNTFVDGKHINFHDDIKANTHHTYREDSWMLKEQSKNELSKVIEIPQHDSINLFDADLKDDGGSDA